MSLRLALSLALAALACHAQSDRGTLTGLVTAPSGSGIAAARVEIVNTGTETHYRTGTNGTGQYHMPNLPPGTYSLIFEASGFKKLVRSEINLESAQVLRVDAVLEISTKKKNPVAATTSTGFFIPHWDRCGRSSSR